MSTAVWPLQAAIDVVAKADATLSAKLAGKKTYDEGQVPEGQVPNYLVYGSPTESAWDSFGTDGNDGTLFIHIWARLKSTVAGIYDDLERLLHNQRITITGHTVALMRTRLVSIPRDPGGLMHGIVEVRALTQAAA